jgi:deoxyribose-phosphate aldolase
MAALKSGEYGLVYNDIRGCTGPTAESHRQSDQENVLLHQRRSLPACSAKAAGQDFVKTSTGFAAAGATLEDVELMRRVVGPQIGVKAAGGVRTYPDALAMIRAGASRIGSSSGVAILQVAETG